MSYVQEALGTNENGITLGPPTSRRSMRVPRSLPDVTNLKDFVVKLEKERGPFIFFTFEQIHYSGIPINMDDPTAVDLKMFMSWFTRYDPEGLAYISKVMMLRDMPMDKPKWVAEGKVRFKKATYDLYKASMIRVRDISVSQGLIAADPMDHTHFMNWWRKHDQAGWAAAALVLSSISKAPYEVPVKLFEFWKVNQQGNLAPPSSLLGLGLWCMFKRNWFWIGAGAVGGAAIYKLKQHRSEQKDFERAKTMMANCSTCK